MTVESEPPADRISVELVELPLDPVRLAAALQELLADPDVVAVLGDVPIGASVTGVGGSESMARLARRWQAAPKPGALASVTELLQTWQAGLSRLERQNSERTP